MAKEMYCKLAVLYMSVNCGYILKNYSKLLLLLKLNMNNLLTSTLKLNELTVRHM